MPWGCLSEILSRQVHIVSELINCGICSGSRLSRSPSWNWKSPFKLQVCAGSYQWWMQPSALGNELQTWDCPLLCWFKTVCDNGFHTHSITWITYFIQRILAAWSPPCWSIFMNRSMNNIAGGHGSAQPVIRKISFLKRRYKQYLFEMK